MSHYDVIQHTRTPFPTIPGSNSMWTFSLTIAQFAWNCRSKNLLSVWSVERPTWTFMWIGQEGRYSEMLNANGLLLMTSTLCGEHSDIYQVVTDKWQVVGDRYWARPTSLELPRQRSTVLARITSWYPNFNGSHFGLPPSEIHRMTGLPPKIVWTMTYSHRPRSFVDDACLQCQYTHCVLHLRAYLAALPTNPPECSHRVWSRNGREVFWYAALCHHANGPYYPASSGEATSDETIAVSSLSCSVFFSVLVARLSSWYSSSVFTPYWALFLACLLSFALLKRKLKPSKLVFWALWHWQVVTNKW